MTSPVRRARADLSYETLADMLWGTDPKLHAYMFRTLPTLHKILAAEWPENFGMLCHRQAMTVEKDGALRALLVGHTAAEWSAHFEASLAVQMRHLSAEEGEHLHAAIYWMDRLFPTPRDGAYYVQELAVVEEAQGEGLAKLMVMAAVDRAREKGCQSICLDVAADNAAVAFYQHLGFEVEIETCVPHLAETQRIGPHYHMVCDLEPLA